MANRVLASSFAAAVALSLTLAPAAAYAQEAAEAAAPRTPVGGAGSERRLGFPDADAVRAAGRARGAGVLHGGASRAVRGRPPRRFRGARHHRAGRRRRQLQPVLVRPGRYGSRDQPDVAGDRSARGPRAAAERDGDGEARCRDAGPRGRQSSRADLRRVPRHARFGHVRGSLHPRVQLRAADDAGRLQPERAGVPDRGPRRAAERNGPQLARHPAGRAVASAGRRAAVDGRFAGALGRRHAGRRDHQLPARDQLPPRGHPPRR